MTTAQCAYFKYSHFTKCFHMIPNSDGLQASQADRACPQHKLTRPAYNSIKYCNYKQFVNSALLGQKYKSQG